MALHIQRHTDELQPRPKPLDRLDLRPTRADRIVTRSDRDSTLDTAVAAWDTDETAGHDTVLLAWRRRDVAALNTRARQHLLDNGRITGPELKAPGGRCYAAGDRVIALAPDENGRYVTSHRGVVLNVGDDSALVRFDNGTDVTLTGDKLSADHLDHAYALTVHRVQGATVDTAHVYAAGGGRELAYVALSRARITTHIYATAGTSTQAAVDLENDWSTSTRQCWTLDNDTPAGRTTTMKPQLASRLDSTLRIARLTAERAAVAALADDQKRQRIKALDRQIELQRLMVPPAHSAPSAGRGLGR